MRTAWLGLLGVSFLLTDCIGLKIVAGTRRENSGQALYRNGIPAEQQRITPAKVLETWGNPRRRFVRHGQEHWVYNDGLLWQGIVAWVVIPVPVLVPMGVHRKRLVFEHDSLVSCTTRNTLYMSFGLFCNDIRCRTVFGERSTDGL